MRLLLSWLLVVACEGSGLEEKPADPEDCTNLADDDGDDLVDCADPDCASLCGEDCSNGVDDDGDGLADCADPMCDGLCSELCDDGRDNDGDGRVDCDDRDCLGSCPEICDDGLDNDGNTRVDCLDEACVDPACPEVCTDERDNDADGLVDCDDPDCVSPVCPEDCFDARDNDGDGLVDCDDSDCDGDCPEVCDDGRDNDADGLVDCDDPECTARCDADGDGFFSEAFGGDDCDDTRFEVNPARPEICNGDEALDDDCDGLVDEADPDIEPLSLIGWYPDEDGDGHGGNADVRFACQQPPGWAAGNLDCDDENPEVNPDMPEICNIGTPLDDDCDGLVDDADPDVDEESYLAWFADRDGDGFGSGVDFEYACSRPEGTAATDDDCDDDDPEVGPPSLWYPDLDGDRHGADVPFSDTPTCDPPAPGHAPDWHGLDCDDDDPDIYPGAPEICEDDIDQDCDGADTGCWCPGDSESVILNPSFEDGAGEGWTSNGVLYDGDIAYDGVISGGTLGNYYVEQTLAVPAPVDELEVATFQMYFDDCALSSIEWWYEDGSADSYLLFPRGADLWEEVDLRAMMTPGRSLERIRIWGCSGGGADEDWVYRDAFLFCR